MTFDELLDSAPARDAADPLTEHRDRFHLPVGPEGEPLAYLCGNSLGLQPKATAAYVQAELDAWSLRGVNGHFEGPHPWFSYHELCTTAAAHLVGANADEVVVMNALTVNLHLLMVSFYRPTPTRYRIVVERGAFPSDRYAVASQARFHGFDPDEAVVELAPRDGATVLEEADVETWLEREGESVALVLFGGVNYLTGQLFDLRRLTRAAHRVGAVAGFDLAHAVGNVPLALHEWDVDFAAWCSYKYLNAGPGGVAGAFVHERHADDASLPRFAGWWGNDPATRFAMPDAFRPARGAAGWQLSNAPILPMAAFRASGDLFLEVGMAALRQRSLRLSAYLDALLDAGPADRVEVITPRDPDRRGCQVSLRVRRGAAELQRRLEAAGIVGDFRPPDVVRIAPVPLYNTFSDVARFAKVLWEATR